MHEHPFALALIVLLIAVVPGLIRTQQIATRTQHIATESKHLTACLETWANAYTARTETLTAANAQVDAALHDVISAVPGATVGNQEVAKNLVTAVSNYLASPTEESLRSVILTLPPLVSGSTTPGERAFTDALRKYLTLYTSLQRAQKDHPIPDAPKFSCH